MINDLGQIFEIIGRSVSVGSSAEPPCGENWRKGRQGVRYLFESVDHLCSTQKKAETNCI